MRKYTVFRKNQMRSLRYILALLFLSSIAAHSVFAEQLTHTRASRGMTGCRIYQPSQTSLDSEVPASICGDYTAPAISDISVEESDTTAYITWTTDESGSSQVTYGAGTEYGVQTAETDTSPRVTSHAVELTDLTSCTTYHFAVSSEDALLNTGTSEDQTFTTAGCAGNAQVISEIDSTFDTTIGGQVEHSEGGATLTATVPEGVSEVYPSVVIQIKALDKSTVLDTIDTPSGVFAVGDIVFDVKAIVDGATVLDVTDAPITLTVTYEDSDITLLDESTLVLYHYHNNEWVPLDDCAVNTEENSVSCTTTSFSVLGLFGEEAVIEISEPTTPTVVDVQGDKQGNINVVYSDDSVQTYKIFRKQSNYKTVVKQYFDSEYWLVLNGSSSRVALVNVQTGEIESRMHLMKSYKKHNRELFLYNFLSNIDDRQETVILSQGKYRTRVWLLVINWESKKFVKKSTVRHLSKKINIDNTLITKKGIQLRNNKDKIIHKFIVTKNYRLK